MSRSSLTGKIRRDRLLAEEVHRYDLPSGLPLLVLRKPGYHKKFAVLSTNFGSVDKAFVDRATGKARSMPDGVAHFLEHKLFERQDGDAFERFSRNGASANAATSFRSTSYFFTCSENFGANLATLLSFVREAEFTEKGIEKERGIIDQEIRMYEDSPDWRCFMNLVQGLFVRHPVKIDITGTHESIAQIDLDALTTCYENFYQPANMCLIAAGDLDPEETAAVSMRCMGSQGAVLPAERIEAREPARVSRRYHEEEAPVQRAKLNLGFKDLNVPVCGEAQQRRDLLTAILLGLMFGSSSRVYQDLYEKGIIDDTFYSSYAGEEDFGFVTLGGEADDPDRLRAVVMREVRRFGRQGFSTEDFGRIVHKMMGRFVRSLDSPESTSFLLMTSAFSGTDPFRTPSLLRRISADDVMERHSELFGDRNHSTSIVRPSGTLTT